MKLYNNKYYNTPPPSHTHPPTYPSLPLTPPAPLTGRAVSEIILDDDYTTIDLGRMNFDRVILNKPIYEDGIV